MSIRFILLVALALLAWKGGPVAWDWYGAASSGDRIATWCLFITLALEGGILGYSFWVYEKSPWKLHLDQRVAEHEYKRKMMKLKEGDPLRVRY